jgi:hypothetical protein
VALLAAAAVGALVLPRHERDHGPLAGLFDDDVTIVSAQRVDVYRKDLSVDDGLVLFGRDSLVHELVVDGEDGSHRSPARSSASRVLEATRARDGPRSAGVTGS